MTKFILGIPIGKIEVQEFTKEVDAGYSCDHFIAISAANLEAAKVKFYEYKDNDFKRVENKFGN